MSKRRVVVTGLGLLTPLGNDVATTWAGILEGKSGITTIEHFDTEGYTTTFGGSLKGFDASQYMAPKDARKMDLFIQYGIAAGIQAIEDSGIEITEQNAHRFQEFYDNGVVFGDPEDHCQGHTNRKHLLSFFDFVSCSCECGNLGLAYENFNHGVKKI